MKRIFSLSVFVLCLSLLPITGFTAGTKLLQELTYDEKKGVLSGKTEPSVNVYIEDLAGSVVADETGKFEIPIPKDLKVGTVAILDAEGANSTDLRFNFEKNTIESEETTSSPQATSQETKPSDSSSAATSVATDASTDESGSITKETDSSETDPSKIEASSNQPDEGMTISSESYHPEEVEVKRSLVWLWTLLVVVGVLGLLIGIYCFFTKKIQREEQASLKRKGRSQKKRTDLEDEWEDDLYTPLFKESPRNLKRTTHQKKTHPKQQNKRKKQSKKK